MQQMMQQLLATMEGMEADRKAYHEEMMAMVDACHKWMMDGLSWKDGGRYTEDRTRSRNDAVHRGASRDPQGRSRSNAVEELRKRRRVRNLAAERRQKMKERIRGKSGSRRKSAAACRKVSRRAKVAWRKKKLVRRIRTQENCEPRKELAVARREMTHRAKSVTVQGEHR
jgi:hypothetical protein